MFYQSRWRLAILYTSMMFCIFAVMIFMGYRGMLWAVSSEQARELLGVVKDIADADALLMQKDDMPEDLGYRERMFFYSFDLHGNLQYYSKAPQQLEDDVLALIQDGQVPFYDVATFELSDDKVMIITASYITFNDRIIGVVYLGKDISALYRGATKYAYFLLMLALVALILAGILGYYLSGCVIRPMQNAYEKQRQFTADASHELRTPLSVIMSSADLLYNDPSIESPFLKQVIADVKDEVKKMSKLVGDLLVIARNDNNAEKLNLQDFDLSGSLHQVVRNMQPVAEKKHIEIQDNVPEGIVCHGDEQKIKQLILILVDNAVKYTPENGCIKVSAQILKNKKIRFSVADNGIGLNEEDKVKIFERFYRVDKARSRAMGGSGLGLAIAKDIIDGHKGFIYVESQLGKGTTFAVELP